MDFETHRILADNAFKKVEEMYQSNNHEFDLEMLHFAHVARLHYAYTAIDRADQRMQEAIKKADEMLIKVYLKLGLVEAAKFIEDHR